VQRVYAIADHGPLGDHVVIEVENRSAVPFAVALVVRPFNVEGLAAIERITFLRQEMETDASVAIEAGEVPLVVTTATKALNADLLVIGRGSTPRAHGHLPTNAYAIVRQSACPVVTI
jgi:nucleotide-binding universal stress UspA family protein